MTNIVGRTCTYEIAYHGSCGQPAVSLVSSQEDLDKATDPRCGEHDRLECASCGRPATHQCSFSGSQFVCGAPLCDFSKHDSGYGHEHHSERLRFPHEPDASANPCPCGRVDLLPHTIRQHNEARRIREPREEALPEDPLEPSLGEQAAEPQPGDWVKVWAQLSGIDSAPEDTTVILQSKVERYIGHVLKDHVVAWRGKPPAFAPPCKAVKRLETGVWGGCVVGWMDHPGKHRDATGRMWDAPDGYIEESV